MASGSANVTYYSTIAAVSTVETVTLQAFFPSVIVTNRQATSPAEIYFTTDGSVPLVGGDNTFMVPAVTGARVVVANRAGATNTKTVVNLISIGTPAYSVEGQTVFEGIDA